jgi:RNA polymerase sigma-70 factor (ECF subfamily)
MDGDAKSAPGGREFLDVALPAADLIYNLARGLTTRPADAEDLVQETYTRAWAAWADGHRPRRTEAWLATICLNAGRDRLRRGTTRKESPWPAEYDPQSTTDVEAEALGRVQRATLEQALRRLPEPQQIAITLMDLCGFTAAETAQITRTSRGTVLARVHRGRKTLARLIHREVTDRET